MDKRPRPVVPQTRSDAAVHSLVRFIEDAGLRVGERLPSERDLAAQLGVSRAVLREALRHLAVLGVVESRMGSGSYLRQPITAANQHLVVNFEAERESLIQLLELRRALETEAAALVALRADATAIAALEARVEALEDEHRRLGDNPVADKAFHRELYRQAGNPLFEQLFDSLSELLERLWRKPLGKRDFAARTLPLHRVVVERIRARDPEGARHAVRELLAIVEEDLRQ